MDKIEKITEIQEENNPTKTLGELLKSYRENSNMDYDQAANTLCLKADTLRALENEQFDLLPEAPYIRGYLRSYAKLGNVSSSEAIARYEALRGDTSTAENLQYNFAPTSSVNNVIKPIISPIILRFAALTVAILALAVISMLPEVRQWSTGVWNEFSEKNVVAQSSSDSSNQAAEDTATQTEKQTETHNPIANNVSGSTNTETTTEIAKTPNMHGAINRQGQNSVDTTNVQNPKNTSVATAATVTPNTVSEGEASSEKQATSTESSDENPSSATASTTPSVASTAENTQTPSNAHANNAASSTESNATSTAAMAANTSNPNATTAVNVNTDTAQTANVNADGTQLANAAENTATSTETNTDAETTGEDSDAEKQASEVSIKLVFTKKVWMRVNSKKKKVFSGLKQNGDVEEFTASKPLSFKVGNAPGVEIYIDGKLYDQTAHTRGAVSRFKIEETP